MTTSTAALDVTTPSLGILPHIYALVNGQPLSQLPDDLYIPPNALDIFVDLFEGPLDLLLYLIKRQNLDIINIPIAQITRQYIAYIQVMDTLNLEMAAEYLVMAALLAEIKSKMLLPRPIDVKENEEDPRATLIRRLQDYECIKRAAEDIDLLPRLERDIFPIEINTSTLTIARPLPDIQLRELLLAFQEVIKKADQLSHHHITQELLSVRERMSSILNSLTKTNSLTFSQLFFKREGRNGVVVSFLAILELSKEHLIEITQVEPFTEIRINALITHVAI